MIKSCIYQILNIINNKFYIGHSQDYDVRWWEHERRLRKNRHENPHLQAAYNKYGADAFEFILVELVNENEMLIKEQYWINTLDACNHTIAYNINPDAIKPPSPLGRKHSAESRLKISTATTGISKTPHIRIPRTDMHKENIGLARRDFDRWPHEDGYNCKCSECRYKRNRMKNYPNVQSFKEF